MQVIEHARWRDHGIVCAVRAAGIAAKKLDGFWPLVARGGAGTLERGAGSRVLRRRTL
jgi:hypothetical protein